MPSSSVTYPAILKFFYDYHLNDNLSSAATCVAYAILYKWNYLRRPKSFRMSNKELCDLSGVGSHIERQREYVIAHCVFEENSLFGYRPRGKNNAGVYYVHTDIIPEEYHNTTTTTPEQTHNNVPSGNDPKTSKEKDQDSSNNTPVVVTTGGEPDDSESKIIISNINEKISEIQKNILGRFPDLTPLGEPVPYPRVRKAVEKCGGDASKITEAMNRMPTTTNCTEVKGIMNVIMSYVAHPEYGLPEGAQTNDGKYKLAALRQDDQAEEDARFVRSRTGMELKKALELVKTYQMEYVKRNVSQINKDYEKGRRYQKPGEEVYKRVKSGYEPPDYPERREEL